MNILFHVASNEDDLLKEVEGSDVGKPPTAVSTTEVPAEDSKAVHTEVNSLN